MTGTNDWAMDGNENDLFEGWFEQGELAAAPEAATYEELSPERSRVGVVVAAVSATALVLVMVFAGRV
jgi:hypothetical protein